MGDAVPDYVEDESQSYLWWGMTSASLRRATGTQLPETPLQPHA